MAELKQLRIRRGQIKSSLKRFRTYIESLRDNIDINQVQDRHTKFTPLWDEFDHVQSQIELLLEESRADPDGNVYVEETERETFENTYFSLNSKVTSLIVKYTVSDPKTSTKQMNSSQSCNMRLPEVSIPVFYGSIETWYDFYNAFNSRIHNNASLTKIQKFQYLKSALQGEAASILTAIDLSDEGYDCAWDILRKRYENTRFIVNKHIAAIFEMPAMIKENTSSLRQIIDGVVLHVRCLNAFNRPVNTWDDILIHLVTSKLDYATNKEWESTLHPNILPTLDQLIQFLGKKCSTLENLASKHQSTTNTNKSFSSTPVFGKFRTSSNTKLQTKPHSTNHLTSVKSISCAFCNKEHAIYKCSTFLQLSVDERVREVRDRGLCINCLRKGHIASICNSGVCRKCSDKHNTLLHPDQLNQSIATTGYSCCSHEVKQVLLSTALIKIRDKSGQYHKCRALLDCGSQSCFITENLVNRLRLKREAAHIPVAGINKRTMHISSKVCVTIRSMFNTYSYNIQCLVLDHITDSIPIQSFDRSLVTIPKDIKLADPNFNASSTIDLLIGAELFWSLICVGQVRTIKGQPTFQKTNFGWIVSGQINQRAPYSKPNLCGFVTNDELNSSIARFWKLDEFNDSLRLSPEEQQCEDHFLNTFQRNPNGRFIVNVPLKQPSCVLGDSKEQAIKRFHSLERKFASDHSLHDEYSTFMREYLSLGHMKLVHPDKDDTIATPTFYFPHHAVIKRTRVTTKLRVVFDGSARSTSGISYNDIQMVGPTVQDDLFSIIARFRIHKYVITADIEKMYRQVLINDSQRCLQRILWREHGSEEIQTYELSTVTYGTASAAFLAIRSLRQLAIEEADTYPIGSKIALDDFYVDDLVIGANTIQELKTIQTEINSMLAKGGFVLRKWMSNDPSILQQTNSNGDFHIISLDRDETTSTLGLQWSALTDVLRFSCPEYKSATRTTKRKILASIARIFDPLGLIGPVIVVAKLIMQQMWHLKIDWDESVPVVLHTKWSRYQEQLKLLQDLSIPRWVLNCAQPSRIELHGFCDASEQAYGACIYIVTSNNDGDSFSHLICSKSRIAPLKVISLPRLELCGALLLARLMHKLNQSIRIPNIAKRYYWTDSTITLAWIKSTARTWKTFVSNRVGEIQDLTDITTWYHVSTDVNPADLLSRGISLETLIHSDLWWKGPYWLNLSADQYPNQLADPLIDADVPERRTIPIHTFQSIEQQELFSRFACFTKLIRITAYSELDNATNRLVKIVQQANFSKEIAIINNQHEVSTKNRLIGLSPFIDKDGLIRVGGRLRHADIPYAQRHPLLLPKNHPFTRLIIEHEHRINLHAGTQATMAAVRRAYWPLGARSTIKSIIHSCMRCFKAKPRNQEYIKGNLPPTRVIPSRPFTNCGIDYFGPLSIREGNNRNRKIVKAYGSIFVCLSTKEIHIELTSDLSTETFLATLKRFMSRRGKPANIYSDNGTNFVGANQELHELYKLFSCRDRISKNMANCGINWHFIPPRAPHFGGIWEAAVKSTKHHLRRVVGEALLTFEEMYTFLVQIEAILNSRPLTPLSDDPNDLTCLTPDHFLIGDSLISQPEPTLLHIPINHLSRWQYVERLKQHFWSRWSIEYLSQLQQRSKWKGNRPVDILPGLLVLIKEDGTPPLRWHLGRVESIHPGQDGVTRAATVRTTTGTYKRPAIRLCPLPIIEGV